MPDPRGDPAPLGATVTPGGVNFSVFSRHASSIDLLLFDRADDAKPARTVAIDPGDSRTGHYWHAFVPKLRAGQIYAFRVRAEPHPSEGLRFDESKVLLDPYGRAVAVPERYSRAAACKPGEDNSAVAMKSVVVNPADYDWEGDRPLRRRASQTIIYELHARGFTANPNSGVSPDKRGTYAGLIEKIPYLQSLGVSAVELLPVFAFDAQDAPAGLVNYWGYSPVSFFAPHAAYASRKDPLGAVNEFRDMVKALHRAGIEVILDVVYNHTAEGSHEGPTLCFKGFDNPVYYMLDADRSRYANFSGTGNTLNANHPVVRRMILDSLRYWAKEMHIDGFRFDLASILSRDEDGNPVPKPPVLWDIDSDPCLAETKLIAEAWDAAGLYQVGAFLGDSWREWNGHFRDDARDFFRRAPGSAGRFADRLIGSPDLYSHKRREAEQSVNFVTCHDGFTLNDLVSYSHKHNEANNENNRDGSDDNRSWNCGGEGPTDNPDTERFRLRQIKNFFTVTLLSLGVPMLLMGDEARRTQRGNNNAYCHDSDLSWFDWSLVEKNAGLVRFVSTLNARRLMRNPDNERERLTLEELLHHADFSWHGTRLNQPDWSENARTIVLGAELRRDGMRLHVILNSGPDDLDFELPEPARNAPWRRWIDTALESPDDIGDWRSATPIRGRTYRARASSVVALISPSGAKPG